MLTLEQIQALKDERDRIEKQAGPDMAHEYEMRVIHDPFTAADRLRPVQEKSPTRLQYRFDED